MEKAMFGISREPGTYVPSPDFDKRHDFNEGIKSKINNEKETLIFRFDDLEAFNQSFEHIVHEKKETFVTNEFNKIVHPGFKEYLRKLQLGFKEESSKRLIECAQCGDINGVLNALKDNADINYVDPDLGTSLMIAAEKGNLKLVNVLLETPGIYLNINSPLNALHLAAGNIGKGGDHGDIVLKLLTIPNQNLNNHSVDYWRKLVSTKLLHSLCKLDQVEDKSYLKSIKKLIQEGADVNFIVDQHETTRKSLFGLSSPFTEGFSTLNYAAMYGKSETVKLLLTAPSVNVTHGRNVGRYHQKFNIQNSFYYAAEASSLETMKYLLKHLSTNIMTKSYKKDLEKIRQDCLELPLIKASMMGHTNIVQELLCFPGININCCSDNGVTPLQNAIYYGHIETVRVLLLDPRLIPTMTNDGGETNAMKYAKQNGHKEIVKLLKNSILFTME
jgi:ankyrin repeat protein